MVNLFVIEGRLAKDPEKFQSKNGKAIVKGSIAVQESKEVVHFLDFTCFGKTADIMIEWCKKGALVSLSGKITHDNYITKTGEKRFQLNLIANSVSLLAKAPEVKVGEKLEKKY
jgi:single-strand DNA-binding protein